MDSVNLFRIQLNKNLYGFEDVYIIIFCSLFKKKKKKRKSERRDNFSWDDIAQFGATDEKVVLIGTGGYESNTNGRLTLSIFGHVSLLDRGSMTGFLRPSILLVPPESKERYISKKTACSIGWSWNTIECRERCYSLCLCSRFELNVIE